MKTRYKIIIVIISILTSLQIITTADCLADEGQPGLFICIGPSLNFILPQASADCAVNEDWPEAPCLDQIINGRYNQDDVNKWSEYYSYKGSAFMELKYLALNNAIKENKLQEWVDDSVINQNVYQYYFFSGRAPNIGQIHGEFDITTANEETFAEEILIFVENKMRRVYYTGENIISILAEPETASVIFETGKNAKLDVKIPRVYEIGPGPLILQNGEEVEAVKDADKCFFYATIETQEPEKIEIIFIFWPEYPETVENCETFEEQSTREEFTDEEICGIGNVLVDGICVTNNFRDESGEIICKGHTSGGGFLEYPECGPIDQFVIHVLVIVLPVAGIISGIVVVWRRK